MNTKKPYIAPTVKVIRMALETKITVDCSPVNPDKVKVNDWELGATQAENEGNIWMPI